MAVCKQKRIWWCGRKTIEVDVRKRNSEFRAKINTISKRKIIAVSKRKIIAVSRRKIIAVYRRKIISVSRRQIIAIYLIKEYGPYGPQGPWAHKTKMFLLSSYYVVIIILIMMINVDLNVRLKICKLAISSSVRN